MRDTSLIKIRDYKPSLPDNGGGFTDEIPLAGYYYINPKLATRHKVDADYRLVAIHVNRYGKFNEVAIEGVVDFDGSIDAKEAFVKAVSLATRRGDIIVELKGSYTYENPDLVTNIDTYGFGDSITGFTMDENFVITLVDEDGIPHDIDISELDQDLQSVTDNGNETTNSIRLIGSGTYLMLPSGFSNSDRPDVSTGVSNYGAMRAQTPDGIIEVYHPWSSEWTAIQSFKKNSAGEEQRKFSFPTSSDKNSYYFERLDAPNYDHNSALRIAAGYVLGMGANVYNEQSVTFRDSNPFAVLQLPNIDTTKKQEWLNAYGNSDVPSIFNNDGLGVIGFDSINNEVVYYDGAGIFVDVDTKLDTANLSGTVLELTDTKGNLVTVDLASLTGAIPTLQEVTTAGNTTDIDVTLAHVGINTAPSSQYALNLVGSANFFSEDPTSNFIVTNANTVFLDEFEETKLKIDSTGIVIYNNVGNVAFSIEQFVRMPNLSIDNEVSPSADKSVLVLDNTTAVVEKVSINTLVNNTLQEVTEAGNTTTIDSEFNSTGYLKLPSGTTAERPAVGSASMVRYNSTTKSFEIHTNTTDNPTSFQWYNLPMWNTSGDTSRLWLDSDLALTLDSAIGKAHLAPNYSIHKTNNLEATTLKTFGQLDFSMAGDAILNLNNGDLSDADVFLTIGDIDAVDSGKILEYDIAAGEIHFDGNLVLNALDYMKIPVGTQAQRPALGVTGMLRFNTTENKFEGHNDTEWVNLDAVTNVALVIDSNNILTLLDSDNGTVSVDLTQFASDSAIINTEVTLNSSYILSIKDSAGNVVTEDLSVLAIDTDTTNSTLEIDGSNNLVLTDSAGNTVSVSLSTFITDTNITNDSLVLSGSTLILTDTEGGQVIVDLTSLVQDSTVTNTTLALDSSNILTLTDSEGNTVTADLSSLVDDTVVTNSTLAVDGSNNLVLTDSLGNQVSTSLSSFLENTTITNSTLVLNPDNTITLTDTEGGQVSVDLSLFANVPNLQEVTDEGYTTSNPIRLTGTSNYLDISAGFGSFDRPDPVANNFQNYGVIRAQAAEGILEVYHAWTSEWTAISTWKKNFAGEEQRRWALPRNDDKNNYYIERLDSPNYTHNSALRIVSGNVVGIGGHLYAEQSVIFQAGNRNSAIQLNHFPSTIQNVWLDDYTNGDINPIFTLEGLGIIAFDSDVNEVIVNVGSGQFIPVDSTLDTAVLNGTTLELTDTKSRQVTVDLSSLGGGGGSTPDLQAVIDAGSSYSGADDVTIETTDGYLTLKGYDLDIQGQETFSMSADQMQFTVGGNQWLQASASQTFLYSNNQQAGIQLTDGDMILTHLKSTTGTDDTPDKALGIKNDGTIVKFDVPSGGGSTPTLQDVMDVGAEYSGDESITIVTTDELNIQGDSVNFGATGTGSVSITGNTVTITALDENQADGTPLKYVGVSNSGTLVKFDPPAAPAIPTLQEVLDAGNVSTTDIDVNGTIKSETHIVESSGGLTFAFFGATATEGVLKLSNGVNSGFLVKGSGNTPIVGTSYVGSVTMRGFGSGSMATHANDYDLATFNFFTKTLDVTGKHHVNNQAAVTEEFDFQVSGLKTNGSASEPLKVFVADDEVHISTLECANLKSSDDDMNIETLSDMFLTASNTGVVEINAGIVSLIPATSVDIEVAMTIPKGTTAERGSDTQGRFRFNTDIGAVEYYGQAGAFSLDSWRQLATSTYDSTTSVTSLIVDPMIADFADLTATGASGTIQSDASSMYLNMPLRFTSYGGGTTINNPVSMLGVQADGEVVEVDAYQIQHSTTISATTDNSGELIILGIAHPKTAVAIEPNNVRPVLINPSGSWNIYQVSKTAGSVTFKIIDTTDGSTVNNTTVSLEFSYSL